MVLKTDQHNPSDNEFKSTVHNSTSPNQSNSVPVVNGERRSKIKAEVEDDDVATEGDDVAVEQRHLAYDDDDGIKTVQNVKSFLLDPNSSIEDESGSEEEQAAFMKELEVFHKERFLEFKPPKFYGEPLNCLKLWRSVIRNGGYDYITAGKVWRTVGEAFNPPKTCTTVSWTFRCFYEKALLEYEKYMMSLGVLPFNTSCAEPTSSLKQTSQIQTPGSGRARRDAAARAMQGWHSQRNLGNGEVGDPIIKDKTSNMTLKREKQAIGLLKRKKPSSVEQVVNVARMKPSRPQFDSPIVDLGPPADWVKINVQRTKDCFEVYALVPGLLREEVVNLPSRIDPHQTSAVVTLHGQLFVRVPFEQSGL
ncbi:AT-rich interactive domain-containing protein 5-like isoform X2 [Rutidosis leptorrhynchoides]|uniref:AT-rich interactive domain-containing protein 5-like isoform X2 n=1 Tax=Rutidosis leptorrhynchoides TaxID=125765 RepID=UPI003A9943D4